MKSKKIEILIASKNKLTKTTKVKKINYKRKCVCIFAFIRINQSTKKTEQRINSSFRDLCLNS